MKKVLNIAAAAIVMGVASFSTAQAEQVKLAFAAEPYPPFTNVDASGTWVGWEVEFADAVCKQAQLDCVITPVAWDGIIPALTSKKIDMIVGSMSITEERLKTIDFTDKYYNTPTSVGGNKSDTFDATPEGVTGKIIGAQVSTINLDYALKHFAGTAAEIKEYQTQDEAQQDLAAGRVDAIVVDAISLKAFLESDQGGCCESKGDVADDPAILGAGVGIGIRKEDGELKAKLNAAIKAIRENGTYDEFSKKYFDFDIYGG